MIATIPDPRTIETHLECRPAQARGSEICNWRYVCPVTQRLFNIRELEHYGSDPAGPGRRQVEFFLEEFRPTGVIVERNKLGLYVYRRCELVCGLAKASPNAFAERLCPVNVDLRNVVRKGGSFSPSSRYFGSISACVEQIHAALVNDHWYQDCTSKA